MKPNKASKDENAGNVNFNLYGDLNETVEPFTSTFKIGDQVRISGLKRYFEKGYIQNSPEEIFVIREIVNTNLITYRLKDLLDENIEGTSILVHILVHINEQELSPAKQEIFRIEKIIKHDYKKR